MLFNQEYIPIRQIIGLFAGLMVAGTLLVLPLFSFKFSKFFASTLFVKIVYWIPIFAVFVTYLYLSNAARLLIIVAFLVIAGFEALAQFRRKRSLLILGYYAGFAAALALLWALPFTVNNPIPLLITLCFASVLSDVVAFFFGKYLGRHKLPAAINSVKSWEGVAGQFIGAVVGVLLVDWLIIPVPWPYIFLAIGIGSAAGDLINSFVKHRLDIPVWSNAIPGHGGYLDRLSSLSGAAALSFMFQLFL